MGNDQSQIKGLEIDKKAIDSNDFWAIFNGELKNENSPPTLITIFQEFPEITLGQLWINKSPLERATRNLMLYRHPSILRFITSWEKGSVHFLATERCKPLALVLGTQNDTQICLGLRNILCALIFLVEKAKMCHLNVCLSSIYVNSNGSWRLGGFEHLWSEKDVNQTLLERSQPYRYANALHKDETKRDSNFAIESFAFGVLCDEILSNRKNSSTIPNVAEFRKYCCEHLINTSAENRHSLFAVLQHSYFNQDFALIHSFLSELPLKNAIEKQTFFSSLVDRLREFDESVIGTELIDLILSRMVLLDQTAKLCVLPFVLQPRNDCDNSSASITPIFTPEMYTKFVVPKIKQLFLVRDVQIRLVLLDYFPAYIAFDSKDVLTNQILPQLLLGIKDTNDQLVSATLRCLADLVPILGSSVVIGSKRSRIFADGKPNGVEKMGLSPSVKWAQVRSITPVMNGAGISADIVSSSPLPQDAVINGDSFGLISNSSSNNVDNNLRDIMPQRLSPDGADQADQDGRSLTNEQTDFDEDGWSDWEQHSNELQIERADFQEIDNGAEEEITNSTSDSIVATQYQRNISISSSNSTANNQNNETLIKDVKDIEIKPNIQLNNEIDNFFKEMEPVIAMSSTMTLLNKHLENATSEKDSENLTKIDQNRFAVTLDVDDDAWGDEANDWEV